MLLHCCNCFNYQDEEVTMGFTHRFLMAAYLFQQAMCKRGFWLSTLPPSPPPTPFILASPVALVDVELCIKMFCLRCSYRILTAEKIASFLFLPSRPGRYMTDTFPLWHVLAPSRVECNSLGRFQKTPYLWPLLYKISIFKNDSFPNVSNIEFKRNKDNHNNKSLTKFIST